MSKVLIINLTRIAQQVEVRHADGTLDAVRLMPRSRLEMREGMNVDTRWLQKNQGVLNIVNPTVAVVQPTVASTVTTTEEA